MDPPSVEKGVDDPPRGNEPTTMDVSDLSDHEDTRVPITRMSVSSSEASDQPIRPPPILEEEEQEEKEEKEDIPPLPSPEPKESPRAPDEESMDKHSSAEHASVDHSKEESEGEDHERSAEEKLLDISTASPEQAYGNDGFSPEKEERTPSTSPRRRRRKGKRSGPGSRLALAGGVSRKELRDRMEIERQKEIERLHPFQGLETKKGKGIMHIPRLSGSPLATKMSPVLEQRLKDAQLKSKKEAQAERRRRKQAKETRAKSASPEKGPKFVEKNVLEKRRKERRALEKKNTLKQGSKIQHRQRSVKEQLLEERKRKRLQKQKEKQEALKKAKAKTRHSPYTLSLDEEAERIEFMRKTRRDAERKHRREQVRLAKKYDEACEVALRKAQVSSLEARLTRQAAAAVTQENIKKSVHARQRAANAAERKRMEKLEMQCELNERKIEAHRLRMLELEAEREERKKRLQEKIGPDTNGWDSSTK